MGNVAIIGGGIVGASIAYHLSQFGDHSIKVYERKKLVGETTSKSVALFGLYGNETGREMKKYGLEMYNELFEDSNVNSRYKLIGRLVVSTTKEGACGLKMDFESEDIEDPICYIPDGEIKQRIMCPYLNENGIFGSTYQPNVGYFTPVELAQAIIAKARQNGVEFCEFSEVNEIVISENQVEGIIVNGDMKKVDAVVCAAGPWNPIIAKSVGIELPIAHTLAPIVCLEASVPMKTIIPFTQHVESGTYIIGRDYQTTYVGKWADGDGQYDPDKISNEIPPNMKGQMLDIAKAFFPILEETEETGEWVGIRSSIEDGVPIVGWTEKKGFLIAAFDSSGIQLAPAVGNIIAKQLLNGDPTEFYDRVSISRFKGHRDVKNKLD
jgi:sarcosine oxidase subunit beta